MASGNWIKMRVDLREDPAVISISTRLKLEEDLVVGKLHKLWSWADKQTSDGTAKGIDGDWVDRYLSCPGFAEAMIDVGWLSVSKAGIAFPGYLTHNGETAKQRAQAAERQRKSRRRLEDTENCHDISSRASREHLPLSVRAEIYARDTRRCVYCGTRGNRENHITIDHIVPAKQGGGNDASNLASCCFKCNNEKNNRTPEEWGMLPQFLNPGLTYMSQKIVTMSLPEKRREENINTPPISPVPGDSASPAAPQQDKPKRKAKRSDTTPMPEGFGISKRVRDWAYSEGYGLLEKHLAYFVSACKAKDYRYVDWDSALMNAIRSDWARLRVGGPAQQKATNDGKDWWETSHGIEAKGKELGVDIKEGEAFPFFKARVFRAAGNGPWLKGHPGQSNV